MKHSIVFSVKFSFQGVDYEPFSQVDLGQLLDQSKQLPSLHLLIANENNIDTYSYLYEVMEQSEIICSNPTGLAIDFINDQRFDNEGFVKEFSTFQLQEKLQQIVYEEMSDDNLNGSFLLGKLQGTLDLADNKPLKNALLKAYQLGINES
jgi:hypothetical protein